MPTEALEGGEGHDEEQLMPSIRRVIEYSGLTFVDVLQLPTDVFLLMVKNHYLDELQSTQEGRDYLAKCKRLNTTEADRNEVSKFLQRSGKDGK